MAASSRPASSRPASYRPASYRSASSRRLPRALLVAVSLVAVALAACTPDGSDEPAPEVGDDALVVTGRDDLTWDVEELSAPAGEIEFLLLCEDQVAHDIVIEETDERITTCQRGGSGSGTVELEAGTYTYFCSIPGHQRTMRGTLEVE